MRFIALHGDLIKSQPSLVSQQTVLKYMQMKLYVIRANEMKFNFCGPVAHRPVIGSLYVI